ncbi:hypothetical protein [Streptomyces sp. NPDC024089]|uniref:hypothetical protein n=1 Tax=Streptomyces sp. NPDC024089 TaxID=3154328 RepID=UPI0033C11959
MATASGDPISIQPQDHVPDQQDRDLQLEYYFAGSAGGAPLSIVRQYIEQQNRPL